MKKAILILSIVLSVTVSNNTVLAQFKLLYYKDVVKIDTSIIKNNRGNYNYHSDYYNNKLHLHLLNKYLLGDLISEKQDESNKYFYIFNLTDSNIIIFKDYHYDQFDIKFIFNNNLYFIASRGNDRKNNTSIVKVDIENKKLKEYNFRGADVSILDIFDSRKADGIAPNTLLTDSAGNLKILCKFFKTRFNAFNFIFFFVRSIGKVWEINPRSEQRKWYIFDENLNLLYTEPYLEKRKK